MKKSFEKKIHQQKSKQTSKPEKSDFLWGEKIPMIGQLKPQTCLSFALYFVHMLVLLLAALQWITWDTRKQLDFSPLNLHVQLVVHYVSFLFTYLWIGKMSKDGFTPVSSWLYMHLNWKNVHFLFLSHLDIVLSLWGMVFLLLREPSKLDGEYFGE